MENTQNKQQLDGWFHTIESVEMTDEYLQKVIQGLDKRAIEIKTGCRLTVGGFYDDPRDMNDIPEAVEFLQRWIRLGGLSVMTFNVENPYEYLAMDGFGVWLIAKGYKPAADRSIVRTPEMIEQFLADIAISNRHLGSIRSTQ